MIKNDYCAECGRLAELGLYDLNEQGYKWLCFDCALMHPFGVRL